jgi:hypothetical protein
MCEIYYTIVDHDSTSTGQTARLLGETGLLSATTKVVTRMIMSQILPCALGIVKEEAR